jgi:uncharacterized protein (TIGR00266 family)
MKIEIHHRPAYAMAEILLGAGETVVAESGAMISMDTSVQIETSAGKKGQGLLGGLVAGLKRTVAGESFFQNRFTASTSGGRVSFAPTLVGDIASVELRNSTMILQSTAFLCSGEDITVQAKWGGARSFFGGEGLIMLRATGTGPLVFNSFGGIKEIEVSGEFVVDTGHIVAFDDSLMFNIRKFGGGWRSFIFGGEGLVCHFSGRGRLWIQTRNPIEFGKTIGPKLPMREH